MESMHLRNDANSGSRCNSQQRAGLQQRPLIASELAVDAGRLFLVDRGGQTQASIAVGEVGIDLLDPDSFALDVLGDIMNGFGGRLFDELRSKEV